MPAKDNCNAGSSQRGAKLKAISLAVMSAAVFSSANAAGLGKITVLSGLGQPLNAEIELNTASREEANGLSVRLASVEAFRQANIDFNAALYSLRFAIEQRAGRSVVRITSGQPLNEPFVDLLLEVSGNNSKLVREYTFLLDPPELRKPQAPQTASATAAPVAASGAARAPAAEAGAGQGGLPRTAGKQRAVEPAGPGRRATAAAHGQAAGDAQEVEVKRGDTLGRIAAEVKPDNVSLDQMLVALYRANPNAFVGNNMNRLRAGQILKVPDAGEASSIGQSEAHGVVVAQAADFNSYRNKLAAQVSHAAPRSDTETGQGASGKITSRVEEQANPVSGARDKLTVSRAGLTPGAAAADNKIARDKAAADADARVKELEKNVSDLQKLLELKNKDMAERQQQAAAKPVPAEAAASAVAAAPATASAASTPAAPAPVAAAPNSSAPAAAVSEAPAAAAKPAAKPKFVAPPPPPPPTLMEELMDNPLLLGAGGGLLAALAALGLRFARKRRELKKAFSDSAILADSGLRTNSLFGATGGQSVDTSSVFNSSFTPSASQLDTNEVDPVAEADVYIAYGRDAQAEEILKEALRTQPDRHAVRVKLLEIYASRKDLRAFDTVASELYSMTKGDCPEWAQAIELGAAIDPNNPLYAGAKGGQAAAAAAPAAAAEELDLDALLNTTTAGMQEDDGENTLIFDDEPAAPAAEVAAQEPAVAASQASPGQDEVSGDDALVEPPAEADTNLMEFSVEPPATAPAAAEPPVPAIPELEAAPLAEVAAEGDGNTLDFDFDLSALGAKELQIPDVPALTPTKPEMPAVPELPALAPAAAALPTPPADEPEAEGKPDFDFNFDLLKPVADKPLELPALADEGEEELGEAGEPDEGLSLPALSTPSLVPAEFDMNSINLDLGTPVPEMPGETITRGTPSQAEMATKLDLALAYQEIGDVEGARELLDEVMKGGNPEQVGKARDMLEKLV